MKYSLRIGIGVACSVSLIYLLGCLLVFALMFGRRWARLRVDSRVLGVVFLGCMTVLAAIQLSLDPYRIQVDRWSAIHNFLSLMMDGEFPYMAQTHLGGYGSPFPVWQIFHLPFYFLNDVGLSVFLVWGALTYAVRSYAGNVSALRTVVLLILSPAFVYEVVVRSDMVTNFMLVAAIVILLYKHRTRLDEHYWTIAIGCGLLMSTRLTAVVPLGMYYLLEWWKMGSQRRMLFPMVVVVVFGLTFLPFIVWDMNDLLFFKFNPFVLQSRQIHAMDFILFVPLFVYWAAGWTYQAEREKGFPMLMKNTAAFLLTLVVVTFLHNMVISANYDLFSSTYDITYLDMSLPFLVTALSVSSR
ncbi:MAG: hypothetical protein I3J02_03270 [Prevotella sp.]|nr:hypothetical protein [Prevotella sp.]